MIKWFMSCFTKTSEIEIESEAWYTMKFVTGDPVDVTFKESGIRNLITMDWSRSTVSFSDSRGKYIINLNNVVIIHPRINRDE